MMVYPDCKKCYSHGEYFVQSYNGGFVDITKSAPPSKMSDIDQFINTDGSYSLYDNKRTHPDNIFHEQILSAKVSTPSASLKNGKMTLGSYQAKFIIGSWEMKYLDLSLLDFGSAKVAAGLMVVTLKYQQWPLFGIHLLHSK